MRQPFVKTKEATALTERRTDEAKQLRKEMRKIGKDFSPRRMKELVPRDDEVMNTITTGQSKEELILNKTKIRRLTPVECCRLQGFPDDWNEKGIIDGEIVGISDTQRYKQCGNAVTVDVVQAVAERIYAQETKPKNISPQS